VAGSGMRCKCFARVVVSACDITAGGGGGIKGAAHATRSKRRTSSPPRTLKTFRIYQHSARYPQKWSNPSHHFSSPPVAGSNRSSAPAHGAPRRMGRRGYPPFAESKALFGSLSRV
jgi:hypothetical protein